MSYTPDEVTVLQEWKKLVETSVRNAMGAELDGDFLAADYPAGFNYAIKQQYYNADSLSALDTLIVNSDGILSIENVFSTLYNGVIKNLEYNISSSDLSRLVEEEQNQAGLVGSIIDEYNNKQRSG